MQCRGLPCNLCSNCAMDLVPIHDEYSRLFRHRVPADVGKQLRFSCKCRRERTWVFRLFQILGTTQSLIAASQLRAQNPDNALTTIRAVRFPGNVVVKSADALPAALKRFVGFNASRLTKMRKAFYSGAFPRPQIREFLRNIGLSILVQLDRLRIAGGVGHLRSSGVA